MMMEKSNLPVLAISLLFLLPLLQATSFKYCDKKGNYAVKIQEIKISPDPVVKGKPATFKILCSSGEGINGGKVNIQVSYFGIHVHTENHDLCEESSCPIVSGNFALSHTQTLPGFTPPGSYTLRMTMEDENGHDLTCFTFNFKIGFGSSVSYA